MEDLPEPKSRKEAYLATIAGMDAELPDAPKSREEQYLNYIAENGGGGGEGGTDNFNQLRNRPKYGGVAMTGNTDIPVVPAGLGDIIPATATATNKLVDKTMLDTAIVNFTTEEDVSDLIDEAIGQLGNADGETF